MNYWICLVFLLAAPVLAQQKNFESWDKDKDGRLSRAELPERIRNNFDRVDHDRDGWISKQEDEAFRKRERQKRATPSRGPRIPDSLEVIGDIPYADNENARQTLDLVVPRDRSGDPRPLIVFIHGGGWRNGDKSSGHRRVIPLVADGNYAGASIGYRLSGEAQWPSQMHDCKAAIRWLKGHAKQYNFDPERIGIWGSSAGGHLVSMLGVSGGVDALEGDLGAFGNEDSRVTCVVNFFGPSDFLTMNDAGSKIDHDAPRSPESLLIGGAIQDNKAKARSAAPMTYVSQDDVPIIHFHGMKDPLVPFNQSVVFHAALKKAGVDSTLVTIEQGGHGFSGEKITEQVERFFRRHLLGEELTIESMTIIAPR